MLALLGVLLVLIGVLIWILPNLLAYVIAGFFVFLGLALILFSWQMRGRVVYRRLDAEWRGGERVDEE